MKIISQTFHTEQINSLSQDINAHGSKEFYAHEVSKYLVCIMSFLKHFPEFLTHILKSS